MMKINFYTKFEYFLIDQPSVQPLNKLYSNVMYEIGKVYDFEFYISGYPLPEVEWYFRKCSSYPLCENVYTKIQVSHKK